MYLYFYTFNIIIHSKIDKSLSSISITVWVVEKLCDEVLQVVKAHLASPFPVDHVDVRGDVGSSWVETLVHGSVAVH